VKIDGGVMEGRGIFYEDLVRVGRRTKPRPCATLLAAARVWVGWTSLA